VTEAKLNPNLRNPQGIDSGILFKAACSDGGRYF
jgi:hypothetical protein